MATSFDVVIIGGGASGSLLAANLLTRHEGRVEVALVERRSECGPGVAYSTSCEDHLLNVPARGMSAYPDEPDHFLEWARRRDPAVEADSFVPRKAYGAYLRSVLGEAQREGARSGRNLTKIQASAIDIDPGPRSARVVLSDGSRLRTRAVVLAVGNFPPSVLPGVERAALAERAFVNDPWAEGALDDVAPDATVVLIGSGLTMYDVAIALRSKGHRGDMLAVSRNGLRPASHLDGWRPAPAPPPEADAVSGLAELQEVFERTLRRLGDPRVAVDSFRPLTQRLWRALGVEDRRLFLSRHRRAWDVLRHRAAPEVHRLIDRLVADGSLRFRASALARVRPNGRRLRAVLRDTRSGHLGTVDVDAVVNCTGPASDYSKLEDRLIPSLRNRGVLVPDVLTLGLEIDPETCALLDEAGSPSDVLYAIGPPTKPALWEITAIPEIRVQARGLAGHLSGLLEETEIEIPSGDDLAVLPRLVGSHES